MCWEYIEKKDMRFQICRNSAILSLSLQDGILIEKGIIENSHLREGLGTNSFLGTKLLLTAEPVCAKACKQVGKSGDVGKWSV